MPQLLYMSESKQAEGLHKGALTFTAESHLQRIAAKMSKESTTAGKQGNLKD